jgi:vacuolar-type H+-ATPase subunit C/Vma6
MKTASIIFLIARTHGFQSHLLKRREIIRLLGTQNLKEMVGSLLETEYGEELTRLAEAELKAFTLEKIFQEKLARRWYAMLQITSGKTSELLEAFDSMLEVENLKRTIRSVNGNSSANDEDFIDIPRKYQRVNFPALVGVRTIEEVIDLLRETSYASLEDRVDEYSISMNPLLLEAHLDMLYYTDLRRKISKNPYAGSVWSLVGTEIDLKNLELILTSKYMKLDVHLVQKCLIPLSYRLSKTAISQLLQKEIPELSKTPMFQQYSELLREADDLLLDGDVTDVQTLFSRFLYSYVEKSAIRNPNSLAYVFSYMYLCLREVRNLTTLTIGKELKLNRDRLERLLFF